MPPPPYVPAKISVSFTAKASTQPIEPEAVHVLPLLVERITPEMVPAKIFEPFDARHKVKLLFTFVQLAPLSVDRNIPASVPAKTLEPITVTTFILPAEPTFTCFHWALNSMADRDSVIARQMNNNNLFIVIHFSFDYRFNQGSLKKSQRPSQ
jgi:hypothetical protein